MSEEAKRKLRETKDKTRLKKEAYILCGTLAI